MKTFIALLILDNNGSGCLNVLTTHAQISQSRSQLAPSAWRVPLTSHDLTQSHSSTLLIRPSAASSCKIVFIREN